MKILSIGSDRNLLKEESAVRARVVEYGNLVDELHVIVFSTINDKRHISKGVQKIYKVQISKNVWVYPTNSRSRWIYIFDAYKIGKKIIGDWKLLAGRSNSESGEIGNSLHEVLVTCQDPFESGLAGWFLKRRFRIPLQLQIHTDFLSPYFTRESLLNLLRVKIAKFLIRRADCIRVVSDRIKNSLQATSYKLQATKLPIHTNPEIFLQTPLSPQHDLHKKYPQFENIILMISRLTKEKNVNLAIDTLSEIIKKRPQTGLIIVGNGPEKINLSLQATSYKRQANVVFELSCDSKALASYYKSADVFLLTSNYEGYALVLIEAALAGCPIVTTDVGIVGEILRSGESALACRAGDSACLAKSVEKIIADKKMAEEMALRAQVATLAALRDKKEYLKLYKEMWEECCVQSQISKVKTQNQNLNLKTKNGFRF